MDLYEKKTTLSNLSPSSNNSSTTSRHSDLSSFYMPTIRPPQVLPSVLSHLLRETFNSKSLKSTSILHSHLLHTGLFFADLRLLTDLFISYAAVASPSCIASLLTSTSSFAHTHDPLLYNALIAAFSRRGFPSFALQTLTFIHKLALPFDSFTLCSSLVSATAVRVPEVGRQIHSCASKSGWMSSVFVGGALIDLYAKLNAVADARKVFDEMPVKNTICANALLSGYVESRQWSEGYSLVRRMLGLGLALDECSLTGILRVCAETTNACLGVETHAYLIRRVEYSADVYIQSSLVEMYGKCGLVHKARSAFELGRHRGRDIVLWTSMLNAYGRNGSFIDVIYAFDEMIAQDVSPDEIALLAVLSACSHSGQVERGLAYFESTIRDHRMVPTVEHCGCIVDMMCRAGELEKAWKFVNEMAMEKGRGNDFGVSVWGALLSACKDCGNVSIGELAAQKALELDPKNVGIYVEWSNLYARTGNWDEIEKLREMMKMRGLQKDLGCSWLGLGLN